MSDDAKARLEDLGYLSQRESPAVHGGRESRKLGGSSPADGRLDIPPEAISPQPT